MHSLEGILIPLGKDEEPVDPEEGFGDGGDGPCVHPQCCIERGIEYSANAIVEGMTAMATSEWPISSHGVGRLRALAAFIIDVLDEGEQEVPEIGVAFPIPPKDKHDGQ